MSRIITTSFINNSNVPLTGLTPTIRIRDLSTNALVVTNAPMSEVGDGGYKYVFAAYDDTKNYFIRCDANAAIIARYTFGSTPQDIKGDIVVMQSDVTGIAGDVTGIAGDIGTLQSDVTGIAGDVTGIAGDVTALQSDITTLLNIESGRWVIDAVVKQMIFYAPDNITEIMRFNLLDAAGHASTDSVFERVRL